MAQGCLEIGESRVGEGRCLIGSAYGRVELQPRDTRADVHVLFATSVERGDGDERVLAC